MNRTILLLPLLLLPMGCSLCADPLFQTVPVTGDADGLRKFAGEWFDEEGNLMAVISSSPIPQLRVQTPYNLEPKDARLQKGKIVFRLTGDNPEEISLRLTGEDKLQVNVANDVSPMPSSCSCKSSDPVLTLVLLRNPSPAWQMELALRKGTEVATEIAKAAYDGTMDRLSRVL